MIMFYVKNFMPKNIMASLSKYVYAIDINLIIV